MSNYKVVVKSIELKPGMSDLTGNEVAIEFTRGLQKTIEDVEKGMKHFPEGGNWEIVDHHMLRIDRHVILSVLVKRV